MSQLKNEHGWELRKKTTPLPLTECTWLRTFGTRHRFLASPGTPSTFIRYVQFLEDCANMKDWRGGIIAEGLSDPTVIGRFSVYSATISEDNMPVDYEGNTGRWHGYGVRCSRGEIDALQPYVLHGWYAHFWKKDKSIVVYSNKQFELLTNDRSTGEKP